MAGVKLIVSVEPVAKLAAQPQRRPSVVVVYGDHKGALHLVGDGQPAGWWEQVRSQYRTRYEVDMGDHERQVELRNNPPLAAGGIYAFRASLTVSFRARDPRQIIRRNVQDALVPVYAYVQHVCRNIAAGFSIEQARQAEIAIDNHFAQTISLDEGIDIYRVQARLEPDEKARAYLSAIDEAQRSRLVNAEIHKGAVDAAHGEGEIELLRQALSLEQRRREHQALEGRPVDMVDMVKIMLERDPNNVEAAKDLLLEIARAAREQRDQQDGRQMHIFDVLANRGLLRREDVDSFRQQISDGSAPAAPVQAVSTVAWDDPLPGEPASAPVPAAPVYLALDETLVDQLDEMAIAVQSLYDALAKEPEVGSVVRLSVIGFAERVTTKRSLEAVDRRVTGPRFSPGGLADFGFLFTALRTAIASDVVELKERGGVVTRPLVIVLTGPVTGDPADWRPAHQQLVDREAQRGAPEIVVFGVAGAQPGAIAQIATRPDYAFVADAFDPAGSIRVFGEFVRGHVLRYGRAIRDGEQQPYFPAPDGFRRAADIR